jgi:hypothetical protein
MKKTRKTAKKAGAKKQGARKKTTARRKPIMRHSREG